MKFSFSCKFFLLNFLLHFVSFRFVFLDDFFFFFLFYRWYMVETSILFFIAKKNRTEQRKEKKENKSLKNERKVRERDREVKWRMKINGNVSRTMRYRHSHRFRSILMTWFKRSTFRLRIGELERGCTQTLRWCAVDMDGRYKQSHVNRFIRRNNSLTSYRI